MIHLTWYATFKNDTVEPCGGAVVADMDAAVRECQVKLTATPLARSVEGRRPDGLAYVRIKRFFADDPLDEMQSMQFGIAGGILVESRGAAPPVTNVRQRGATTTPRASRRKRRALEGGAIKGFSSSNYYISGPGMSPKEEEPRDFAVEADGDVRVRVVGFGPGTVTKKEAQHMFDEEKKRRACVRCGATGVELYMTIEPSCVDKEACTLRAENNRLRCSLNDVNRLACTALAGHVAVLESSAKTTDAVPISEADVGKTIGVTGIYDGETVQTFRSDATHDLVSLLLEVRDALGGCAGPITGIAARVYAERAALKVELLDVKARFEATEAYIAATEAYMASRVHGSDDPEHRAWRRARSALSKLTEGKLR